MNLGLSLRCSVYRNRLAAGNLCVFSSPVRLLCTLVTGHSCSVCTNFCNHFGRCFVLPMSEKHPPLFSVLHLLTFPRFRCRCMSDRCPNFLQDGVGEWWNTLGMMYANGGHEVFLTTRGHFDKNLFSFFVCTVSNPSVNQAEFFFYCCQVF